MQNGGFAGMRVLALESRRASEIAKLIQTHQGQPIVAPAVREVPLASNREAFDFAAALIQAKFDLVIFLTGVGVRVLLEIVETKYDREEFLSALRRVKIASRGPKPSAVLRELKIPVAIHAPEPSTWRELIAALDSAMGSSLGGCRIAVQEYGAPNSALLAALAERGSEVTRVPVYRWALPEDLQPLRDCVLEIAEGRIEVVLFLSAIQVTHLFTVAEEMHCTERLRQGLQRSLILSIGPSTSDELRHFNIVPDLMPSHPKMGFLLNEGAQQARKLLERKRA